MSVLMPHAMSVLHVHVYSMMHDHVFMLHVHPPCPCCMFMLHVHVSVASPRPCCMLMTTLFTLLFADDITLLKSHSDFNELARIVRAEF
jgi:hypothetical protein